MRPLLLVAALLVACGPVPSGSTSCDAGTQAAPLSAQDAQAEAAPVGAPVVEAGVAILPVYLWAGQSNAAQQGLVNRVPAGSADAAYLLPAPGSYYSVQIFGNTNTKTSTDVDWEPVQPIAGQVGFEASFAHRMGAVGVLKFAIGASGVATWVVTYRDAEAVVRFQTELAKLTVPYRIAGLIWCQGETENAQTVPTWDKFFSTIIGEMRVAFGADLPVIVVQQPPEVVTGIREAEAAWVAADKHATLVSTADLPYEGYPHWGVPSVFRIGERIADAF